MAPAKSSPVDLINEQIKQINRDRRQLRGDLKARNGNLKKLQQDIITAKKSVRDLKSKLLKLDSNHTQWQQMRASFSLSSPVSVVGAESENHVDMLEEEEDGLGGEEASLIDPELMGLTQPSQGDAAFKNRKANRYLTPESDVDSVLDSDDDVPLSQIRSSLPHADAYSGQAQTSNITYQPASRLDQFPSIVANNEGQYVELRCYLCGTNCTSSATDPTFLRGTKGLQGHMNAYHHQQFTKLEGETSKDFILRTCSYRVVPAKELLAIDLKLIEPLPGMTEEDEKAYQARIHKPSASKKKLPAPRLAVPSPKATPIPAPGHSEQVDVYNHLVQCGACMSELKEGNHVFKCRLCEWQCCLDCSQSPKSASLEHHGCKGTEESFDYWQL